MTSAQPQERCITPYRHPGALSASHYSINAIQPDVLHSSLQTSCEYVHVRLTFPARFQHPSVPAMLPVISLTATTKKASKIPSIPIHIRTRDLDDVQPWSNTHFCTLHTSGTLVVSSQSLLHRSASGSSARCRCTLLSIDKERPRPFDAHQLA